MFIGWFVTVDSLVCFWRSEKGILSPLFFCQRASEAHAFCCLPQNKKCHGHGWGPSNCTGKLTLSEQVCSLRGKYTSPRHYFPQVSALVQFWRAMPCNRDIKIKSILALAKDLVWYIWPRSAISKNKILCFCLRGNKVLH